MNSNLQRIFFVAVLLFSTSLFPWWVTFPLILLGIFFFRTFYEAIFFGFILDRVYGLSDGSFLKTFPLTLSAILLFLLSFWVREHLRLGDK